MVTGATGGLGLAVVEVLRRQGYRVRATGRDVTRGARLEGPGVEFVATDLCTPGAAQALVDGMDSVIHAAALSSPWGAKAAFHAINVAATEALLIAAKAEKCQRFVFVSSPSVYARAADQIGLRESDPVTPRPLNAYAATKIEAERRVLNAANADMACVSIRPRAIVGPDDTVLLPRVLRLMRRGRFPLLRGGQALMELTDVRDVAQALVLAEQRAPLLNGEAVNISGGHALPVREMVERFAQALNLPVKFVPVPYGPLRLAVAGMEAVCRRLPGQPEPPLTVYGLTTLAFSQMFDLSVARERLGFKPAYDAFQSAIEAAS
nr:NAD(P)-dependent oxidoreductase [Asticcacaulis aquaticus]